MYCFQKGICAGISKPDADACLGQQVALIRILPSKSPCAKKNNSGGMQD